MVLSLIITVLAGMGLNFGIVIGAMAGQIALIAVTHWKIVGLDGFMLTILISTPIAVLFGWLTGKILNKTKGQDFRTVGQDMHVAKASGINVNRVRIISIMISTVFAAWGQAILGTTLFHLMFIISPFAGKNLFGNAQISEYFRVFVAYGVIGVSLGLHTWKTQIQAKRKELGED